MHRKSIYVDEPSLILASLGGAVATILATALMYGASIAGLPVIDIPALLGGVFTSDPAAALGWGYLLFFLGGWLVIPWVARLVWHLLPGDRESFGAAALKGLVVGAATWPLSGIALGVLGWLSGAGEPAGFFAAGHGAAGIAALLAGHLVYGVAMALVAAMGRGLSPLDAIGWLGHGSGRAA